MAIGFGIFSGGLDSILAALVLKNQGVDVRLLTFTTPFFGAERALISGRAIGLEPEVLDITTEHLDMLQSPKYGYGRFMNPCIDCHALMFNLAGRIMESRGGDFLFSGEVLGQRPKSQNRQALDIVAKASGYRDRVIRPLSAQALPPARAEEEGWVDRTRLLGFSGRTRKPQMALAEEWGITDYPAPAGGCLLTDPIFSRRLAELMSREGGLTAFDATLLKVGRHFRLPGGGKLAVGRNQSDNQVLERMARPRDTVINLVHSPGPTSVMTEGGPGDRLLAAEITLSYSSIQTGRRMQLGLVQNGGEEIFEVTAKPKKTFTDLMV